MNPRLRLSLGLLIAAIGLLAIAFSNELARKIGGGEHVIAWSIAAMLFGAVLTCAGIWVSRMRIKLPPKDPPPT